MKASWYQHLMTTERVAVPMPRGTQVVTVRVDSLCASERSRFTPDWGDHLEVCGGGARVSGTFECTPEGRTETCRIELDAAPVTCTSGFLQVDGELPADCGGGTLEDCDASVVDVRVTCGPDGRVDSCELDLRVDGAVLVPQDGQPVTAPRSTFTLRLDEPAQLAPLPLVGAVDVAFTIVPPSAATAQPATALPVNPPTAVPGETIIVHLPGLTPTETVTVGFYDPTGAGGGGWEQTVTPRWEGTTAVIDLTVPANLPAGYTYQIGPPDIGLPSGTGPGVKPHSLYIDAPATTQPTTTEGQPIPVLGNLSVSLGSLELEATAPPISYSVAPEPSRYADVLDHLEDKAVAEPLRDLQRAFDLTEAELTEVRLAVAQDYVHLMEAARSGPVNLSSVGDWYERMVAPLPEEDRKAIMDARRKALLNLSHARREKEELPLDDEHTDVLITEYSMFDAGASHSGPVEETGLTYRGLELEHPGGPWPGTRITSADRALHRPTRPPGEEGGEAE